MVGFEPGSHEKLPEYTYAIAGASSGIVTRAIIQPLDVLKIRFQLQVEPLTKQSGSKYYGIRQATFKIYKEETISAFWKGHMPAQFLSVVYGIVQFGTFEVLTRKVWFYLPQYVTTDMKPVTHFVCGGLAGCTATLAAQPFDVIRTHFVAQGKDKVYTSISHAARMIVINDGFRGLYKGLLPTLLQIAPNTGFQFGFYTLFNNIWETVAGNETTSSGGLRSLACGSGAGLCAKFLVYPLDMVKKRLQIQGFKEGRAGFGETRNYRGFLHCVHSVMKREGRTALFKGLSPSLIKAMVSAGCSFSVYEQCLKILVDLRT